MPFLMSKMAKSQPEICFVLTAEFAVKAFLLNHLRALSSLYKITVIVNTNNPNFLEQQGVVARVIPLAIARDVNIISDFSCLMQLIKIFKQQRFSAVHSVTPKAGLLAILASWVVRVPLRIHTFTGQVWATKVGLKRFFLKQLDCLIAYLTTHNLVDSPSQLQFLIEQKVMLAEKATVFGQGSISGVDIAKFKPNHEKKEVIRSQLNIKNGAILFLFLGRLTRDKGVLDLAQAFNHLQNNDTYLLFVGPDEQNMQAEILKLSDKVRGNIHFVGHTNMPESYMAAADVLCLPSYREGFGSVIIEAASVGIPAIASRVYGITDAVIDGETGLLHEPYDIEAIKNCMKIMIVDSVLRLKLSKQAQLRAKNHFDSKKITQKWIKFYQENVH